MSARCSAASAASTSASSEPGCESPGNAKPTSSAAESSLATGPESPATPTCASSVEPVDLLCGGFPCQDISLAGKGAGIDGARSGLWGEYARLVGELRPRYVIVENVAALLARGLGRVLETWPRSGMTRSGTAFLLRPLAPLTDATGSGLWPTPVARTTGRRRRQPGDEGRMKGWPRRSRADGDGEGRKTRRAARAGRRPKVRDAKSDARPTPEAGTANDRRRWTGGGAGRAFKTPTSAPFSHGGSGGELHKQVAPSGGPLNPQWVAWLMGFPIDWTSLPPSETRSSRRSRNGSAGASSKRDPAGS
jgi:hypothetical protein